MDDIVQRNLTRNFSIYYFFFVIIVTKVVLLAYRVYSPLAWLPVVNNRFTMLPYICKCLAMNRNK